MATCALCSADTTTDVAIAPRDETLPLCDTCRDGVEKGPVDGPHWQCLNEAIWSPEPAVQVVAWRLLKALPEAPWAREVLEIAYLEPEVQAWAEEGMSGGDTDGDAVVHVDCNGAVLASGDTVTLIKDLPVKGAGFTAKRGTAVRKISLVPDNAAHIEGRVEGQRIVILTQFVKKA
jgi:protein PhnA